MSLLFRTVMITCLGVLLSSAPVLAEDDQWRILQEGDKYFDHDIPKAMAQTGQETLMLRLDPESMVWMATLVLVGNDQDTEVSNGLTDGVGNRSGFTIAPGAEQLYTNYVGDRFSVFVFPVPEAFIQAAKSTRYWTVTTDLGTAVFRMEGAGSNDALWGVEAMADDILHGILQEQSDLEQLAIRCEQARKEGRTPEECI